MCAQTTATAWIEKNPKDDSSLMLHPMPTYEVPSTEDNTQHHVNLFKPLHHIHVFKNLYSVCRPSKFWLLARHGTSLPDKQILESLDELRMVN